MNKNTSHHSDLLILQELEKLAAALGNWRDHVVLGGGVALLVYGQLMSEEKVEPLGTSDMDWLIPRKPLMKGKSDSISEILESCGYSYRSKGPGTPPVSSYIKEVEDQEIEVEFLTDNKSREKLGDSVTIQKAEVTAQPLSYLEMSLDETTVATLKNGIEIRVVTPEAWVFHKGLTFNRRPKKSSKYLKDLYGIWFVLTQMGDLSVAAGLNLKKLQKKYSPNWADDFSKNLHAWVDQATPKEWDQLVQQDPRGELSKVIFRSLIDRL